MSEQHLRDYLGDMSIDVEDGVMVTDVILIAKTVRMDNGNVGLYMAQTEGVSWIEKIGMLRAAEHIEAADLGPAEDGD